MQILQPPSRINHSTKKITRKLHNQIFWWKDFTGRAVLKMTIKKILKKFVIQFANAIHRNLERCENFFSYKFHMLISCSFHIQSYMKVQICKLNGKKTRDVIFSIKQRYNVYLKMSDVTIKNMPIFCNELSAVKILQPPS